VAHSAILGVRVRLIWENVISKMTEPTKRRPVVRRKLRRQDAASTRDLILAEAMRLIARDGVQELRLKDVADAIGIQAPSIYKHFPNREAIIASLALIMVEEMGAHLVPGADLEPRAWLAAWARGMVWFFSTRPAYVRLLLNDLAVPSGLTPLETALGPIEQTASLPQVARYTDPFYRHYAQGVERGIFRPVNFSHFFASMFGAVLVALVWPYAGKRLAMSAGELEQLQSAAEAIALGLAGITEGGRS